LKKLDTENQGIVLMLHCWFSFFWLQGFCISDFKKSELTISIMEQKIWVILNSKLENCDIPKTFCVKQPYIQDEEIVVIPY